MSTVRVKKVLIVGAGPVTIGQTGTYDDAACQACAVYREAGFQTIVVHCDPSAMASDLETADRTYLLPLTVRSLIEVVEREKPDAVLPSVGGPRALRLVKALMENGALTRCGTRLSGLSQKALAHIDDPNAFCELVDRLGLVSPHGHFADSVAEAAAHAESVGYPVFARAADPSGLPRYGIVYNVEDLRDLLVGGRLPVDTKGCFRIEKALSGHREIEAVLLRDNESRMVIGLSENIEPAGIHSGDSTAVLPPVSLDRSTTKTIKEMAGKLAQTVAVTGAMQVKIALSPANEALVLSMDICFPRIAGFFTKALGTPLATAHAKLTLGLPLKEALGPHASADSIEPSKTVAVRLPRWEFERFPGEERRLGACMKSTGAVMGVGRSFLEAFQRAWRTRSPRNPIAGQPDDLANLPLKTITRRLVVPTPERFSLVVQALKKGAEPIEIERKTGIAQTWIRQFADLAAQENALANGATDAKRPQALRKAAENGFSAVELARLAGLPEKAAAQLFEDAAVKYGPGALCTGTAGSASVFFLRPNGSRNTDAPAGKTVLLVGPGPERIGQQIEMEHSLCGAARGLHAAGRQVALMSANPGAACGLDAVERIYVEPLTPIDLKAVCQAEAPDSVIVQFGGYRTMNMAGDLAEAGFRVLGTSHETMALTQDRFQFNRLLNTLGIAHPQMGLAKNPEEALDMAESIGYPLIARPQTKDRWKQRSIVMEPRMMEAYLIQVQPTPESPILLEQFLEYAIEAEADALCDGRRVYVPAVMEHIELAGVHPGDAAMVIPPYSTPPRHVETMIAYIEKVALLAKVKGLLNTRFAVYNDTVYLLEARPWACRSLPLISKMCDIPMAERAVEIMLGMSLDALNLPRRILPHYGIRASVFPYDTFSKTDPLLGPRMRSTGQTLVLSDVFGMAYFHAQEAAGNTLPLTGDVLITVTDEDKPSILEPARLYSELGFGIQATRGTHAFLKKNGIDAKLVKKVGFGRPDLVDAIKTGEVGLVVNTPSGRQSHQDDATIRNTAIRYRIPNITTPAAALASAKGIAARKKGQEALCTLQSYARAIR